MFASLLTVLPGSRVVFSGYPPDLTEIQCGKEENAKCLDGIRIWPLQRNGIRQNVDTGCSIGKESGIRDRDNWNSGYDEGLSWIRECGIRFPPPRPLCIYDLDTLGHLINITKFCKHSIQNLAVFDCSSLMAWPYKNQRLFVMISFQFIAL